MNKTMAVHAIVGVLLATTVGAQPPFDPSWESLETYECPEWFRDAKLGIFVCWNLHSLQGFDDWYCHNMYREGHPTYEHHIKTYGHPSRFGFKDFIPMWKAEKFDADDLVRGYPFPDDDGKAGREVVAWYYNQNMKWHGGRNEAVMNIKKWPIEKNHGPYRDGTCVRDMERGLLEGIQKDPWQNDTIISTWFYQARAPVRPVNSTVDMLIDIVSKNGNLLLNVPPRPDGSLDEAHQAHLAELGRWMKINGEAIYATRTWKQFGEGPSSMRDSHFNDDKFGLTAKDIRYTQAKDGLTVYA